MAKDRRNTVRPQINLDDAVNGSRTDVNDPYAFTADSYARARDSYERSGEVSRNRGKSTSSSKKKKKSKAPKKKKKLSRAAIIIRCVLVVLVVAVVVFVCVLGNYIYRAIFVDDTEKVPPVPPTTYDTTPVESQGQVAYYLVGLLGEGESSNMDMLSVICYDKQQQTVNVLQIPTRTAIAPGDEWIVDTAGAIWSNPKPVDWCENCHKRVYAPEINETDPPTHTVCGGEITSKIGSSMDGLVDFVNDQLGLPVDAFFLIPRDGLSLMIDAVGGVDVNLAYDNTLAGESFLAGIHTLTGDQAVDYVTWTDNSMERDLLRVTRDREVFGALFARMLRLDKGTLQDDVVEEVMDSSSAIRTDCSVDDMVDILVSMASAGTEKTTFYRLPGESAWDEQGDNVFSVHTDELLALLNASFRPVGGEIAATDITLPQIANSAAGDVQQQTVAAAIAEQTGMLLNTDG